MIKEGHQKSRQNAWQITCLNRRREERISIVFRNSRQWKDRQGCFLDHQHNRQRQTRNSSYKTRGKREIDEDDGFGRRQFETRLFFDKVLQEEGRKSLDHTNDRVILTRGINWNTKGRKKRGMWEWEGCKNERGLKCLNDQVLAWDKKMSSRGLISYHEHLLVLSGNNISRPKGLSYTPKSIVKTPSLIPFPETVLFPYHGFCRNLAQEIRVNPFLLWCWERESHVLLLLFKLYPRTFWKIAFYLKPCRSCRGCQVVLIEDQGWHQERWKMPLSFFFRQLLSLLLEAWSWDLPVHL